MLSSLNDECKSDNYIEPHYKEWYRVAVDTLIEHGLDAYKEFLAKERVSDFLAEEEINYILNNVQKVAQSTAHGPDNSCVQIRPGARAASFSCIRRGCAGARRRGMASRCPRGTEGQTSHTLSGAHGRRLASGAPAGPGARVHGAARRLCARKPVEPAISAIRVKSLPVGRGLNHSNATFNSILRDRKSKFGETFSGFLQSEPSYVFSNFCSPAMLR